MQTSFMDGSFSVLPDVVHGHAEPLVGPAPDVLVEGEEDVFVLVLDVGLDLALQEPRPLEHHRHRLVARHHGLLRRPVEGRKMWVLMVLIGNSLRPGQLGISNIEGILILSEKYFER